MITTQRRGIVALGLLSIFWGTIGPLVRQISLDGIAIASARIWVASIVLVLGALIAEFRSRGSTGIAAILRRHPLMVPTAGFTLAAHWASMIAAFQRIPIATTLIIVYTAPVLIAVVERYLLKRRLNPGTPLAVALGASGAMLLFIKEVSLSDRTGLVYAFCGALSLVLLTLLNKHMSESSGGVALTLVELPAAGFVLLLVAPFVTWTSPGSSLGWLLLLGVAHTAIAVMIYMVALSYVPATSASVLGYLEPVSGMGWAWLFLGESPQAHTLVGGAIVLIAGAVILRGATTSTTETKECS